MSRSNVLLSVKKISRPGILTRTLMGSQVPISKRRGWNRLLFEAEKLVGFPTNFESLSAFMNDDVSNWGLHFRRLMGSDHPLTKTVKRTVFHGRNRLQVRGIFTLLFTRLVNSPECYLNREDFISHYGILEVQRQLAETVELIYTAQCIHKSLLNLPEDLHNQEDSEIKMDLLEYEYGNKIALLGGDYLLAQASMNLAKMRSSDVVELISLSIKDFSIGEFTTSRDVNGLHIPVNEQLNLRHWERKNALSWGGLMANGCKASLTLGNHSKELLEVGYRFGLNLALALQAQTELESIIECPTDGFDLASLPVLLLLQKDKEILASIQNYGNQLKVNEIDWNEISRRILNGIPLEKTNEVIAAYTEKSIKELHGLREDESKSVLIKLINYLKKDT